MRSLLLGCLVIAAGAQTHAAELWYAVPLPFGDVEYKLGDQWYRATSEGHFVRSRELTPVSFTFVEPFDERGVRIIKYGPKIPPGVETQQVGIKTFVRSSGKWCYLTWVLTEGGATPDPVWAFIIERSAQPSVSPAPELPQKREPQQLQNGGFIPIPQRAPKTTTTEKTVPKKPEAPETKAPEATIPKVQTPTELLERAPMPALSRPSLPPLPAPTPPSKPSAPELGPLLAPPTDPFLD